MMRPISLGLVLLLAAPCRAPAGEAKLVRPGKPDVRDPRLP
jgi:hypothetical protein